MNGKDCYVFKRKGGTKYLIENANIESIGSIALKMVKGKS